MYGPIDLPSIAIVAASLIGAFTDLRYGKIFNALTLPLTITALAYGLLSGGSDGALASMIGMGVGLGFYLLLYLGNVIGAGDVKFLAALGAWGGARFALSTGIWAILIGGVFAALLLAHQKKLRPFLVSLGLSFLTPPLSSGSFFQIDHRGKMPFGVPIALAAVWIWFR